jgi:GTP cyclohydrolase II
MLASDATTPSLTSSVRRSGSTRSHYNRRSLTDTRDQSLVTPVFRLEKVAEATFPTRWGQFRIFGFAGHYAQRVDEAVVLQMGDLTGEPAPLVRIHSQCLTGDVFHSLRCDCRAQLELSLARIADEERGLLIYEHQEGRGIGLLNKLRAYELQDHGADTVEANVQLGFDADLRHYELPGAILRYFGLTKVRLLSNNPEKVEAVERAGVRVVERIPCLADPVDSSAAYLRTKKDKMGHLIDGL